MIRPPHRHKRPYVLLTKAEIGTWGVYISTANALGRIADRRHSHLFVKPKRHPGGLLTRAGQDQQGLFPTTSLRTTAENLAPWAARCLGEIQGTATDVEWPS